MTALAPEQLDAYLAAVARRADIRPPVRGALLLIALDVVARFTAPATAEAPTRVVEIRVTVGEQYELMVRWASTPVAVHPCRCQACCVRALSDLTLALIDMRLKQDPALAMDIAGGAWRAEYSQVPPNAERAA